MKGNEECKQVRREMESQALLHNKIIEIPCFIQKIQEEGCCVFLQIA